MFFNSLQVLTPGRFRTNLGNSDNWDIESSVEQTKKAIRPKKVIEKYSSEVDSARGLSLSIRGRGFMEIYNKDLPLDLLWSLVERARFSTHIKEIRFTSEREREEAMRPIWNASSGGGEIKTSVEYFE